MTELIEIIESSTIQFLNFQLILQPHWSHRGTYVYIFISDFYHFAHIAFSLITY